MNKVFLKIVLSVFLIMVSCIKNPPSTVLQGIELEGINGHALYFINKATGKVERVRKNEYDKLEFKVEINKDTLQVNEEFVAYSRVFNKDFTIFISDPIKDTIHGINRPVIESFSFKPLKEGIYDFKGKIEFDSSVIPFEYKFIVLPNR
jgi:hypothetical protein